MPWSDPIPFTKMHGCANDYIFVDAILTPELTRLDPSTIRAMCDRRTGIGADGVIILSRIDEQWGAQVINADGSEGGMCGNGLRCAARLLHERHGAPEHLMIQMGARAIAARVEEGGVSLDMGSVELDMKKMGIDLTKIDLAPRGSLYSLDGLQVGFADIGNPHMAILVDYEPTPEHLAQAGLRFERHLAFPSGMNVHLVHTEHSMRITMRSHERGVGPTQACGSGACAIVALLAHAEQIDREVTVAVPGGKLQVHVNGAACTLIGPAEYVCEGEFMSRSPLRHAARGPRVPQT